MYRCPRSKTQLIEHIPSLNSIDSLNLEDAVLRVVRGVLLMPPESITDTIKTGKADNATKTLESIQLRIDRLLTMHLHGRISELDFERHYRDLVAEKEAEQVRLTADPRPALHLQAQKLAEKGELSREELRQLVLLVVERVEAPIIMDGVSIRPDKKTPRKLARITLTLPKTGGETEFWAPIYSQNFDGHRVFAPCSTPESELNALLIGPRVRDRQR